jgi:DNA processing protein
MRKDALRANGGGDRPVTTAVRRNLVPRRPGADTVDAVRRIASSDPEYPVQLASMPAAPDALWVSGCIVDGDALAVAIVGSRRATPYGLEMTEQVSRELAARGVTIVSGLARGIDGAAHRGALAAGGRTIAVLGSGVDVVYPPEHRRLAREIAGAGALVSHFPPGTPPLPHHFPQRNRIIAGLALGVVVVEAADRSGSLITAAFAAELGREVMAVPGRATSQESRGTNRLIQDGAALVTRWEDVVDQLPLRWRSCLRAPARATATGPVAPGSAGGAGDGDPDTRLVLGALGDEPATIDDVIEASGITSGRAAALLLELELAGRVRQIDGKRFVRAGQG